MAKINTMAILSLIFAFLFFPLGFIFGIISLKQIKNNEEEGRILAIIGIIISLIPIVIVLSFTLIGIILVYIKGMIG